MKYLLKDFSSVIFQLIYVWVLDYSILLKGRHVVIVIDGIKPCLLMSWSEKTLYENCIRILRISFTNFLSVEKLSPKNPQK